MWPTSLDAWAVRAYLLIVPCLWWQGIIQAQAQAVAWQVATVGLVALASIQSRRQWASGLVGGLMCGALASSLFHWPANGYPLLVLLTLTAWATVWSLIQLSPSAEWIEQSVVWLALANVGYALSQWMGYDPLFETSLITGLMSRKNLLAIVWLLAVPLAHRWQRGVLVGAIVALHNWTSLLGVAGLGAWWAWRRWPQRLCRVRVALAVALLGSAMVAWWSWHPALWTMKALPRLLIWQETFGQALWSPIWGFGLGARSAMSTVGGPGDLGYHIWLEAFHAGGALLVVPLVVLWWKVWKSVGSPARIALLLLAWAGCTQSLWNSTGMVVVTLALIAAWELRRLDAV